MKRGRVTVSWLIFSILILLSAKLFVDSNGELVAHGIPLTSARDMAFMTKGIAVRVRDGALKNKKN